jgi:putative transposase
MGNSGKGQNRDALARLRFAIIGPLLAAPPTAGELQQALCALAAKTWRHPVTDAPLTFAASTIERWLYRAKAAAADPVNALRPRIRSDTGQSRTLTVAITQALRDQHQAHPSWSYQLHYDNLRAIAGLPPLPSYDTVRRFMKAQGLRKQPRKPRVSPGALAAETRLLKLEVRSFEVEHVNALWHLDFHHGSRKVLTAQGKWAKPILLGVLDDRSRLCCHAQWYLDETTQSLVHGLCQAFQRRKLPRSLLSDNGAAMVAEEFSRGLLALGIVHETTLPYSPHQNGKQEVLWASVEGRLMAMLDGVEELTLELLNQTTLAWVEQEYHRAVHSELGESPLTRYLAGPDVGRECPGSDALRAAFRLQVSRKQRRSDGTLSLEGRRFEVPARYRHLEHLCVRYARWDLGRVDLVDPRSGMILCPLYPLDKSANASGVRRSLGAVTEAPVPASDMAPLLRQYLADYAATGLPPPYLPTTDPESTS